MSTAKWQNIAGSKNFFNNKPKIKKITPWQAAEMKRTKPGKI